MLAAVLVVATVLGIHRWRALTAVPPVDPDRIAWALFDLHTRKLRTSAEPSQSYTAESIIKVWIAADDLRRLTERGIRPHADEITALSAMIRDSDDHFAEVIYQRNGEDTVIERLISICGLTETTVRPGWRSLTQMSAGTPSGWGTVSLTAAPPVGDGPSGCWIRCGRYAVRATSALSPRCHLRTGPGWPSRTA